MNNTLRFDGRDRRRRRENVNRQHNQAALERMKDKDIIGPGVWFVMHSRTLSVDVKYGQENIRRMNREQLRKLYHERIKIIEMIQDLAESFPCRRCRNNFKEYLRNNPPSYTGEYMSLFYWGIRFHNHKNEILDKPIIDPLKAKTFFENNLECEEENCMITHTDNQESSVRRRGNVKPRNY